MERRRVHIADGQWRIVRLISRFGCWADFLLSYTNRRSRGSSDNSTPVCIGCSMHTVHRCQPGKKSIELKQSASVSNSSNSTNRRLWWLDAAHRLLSRASLREDKSMLGACLSAVFGSVLRLSLHKVFILWGSCLSRTANRSNLKSCASSFKTRRASKQCSVSSWLFVNPGVLSKNSLITFNQI